MELTARIKERKEGRTYDVFDKKWYYNETPCRRYVPFFQHVYYYTKDVPVDEWRPNKNKPDIHIIYSLLICKWLFNFEQAKKKKKKKKKRDKITNSDLILIWWLAFDNDVSFSKERANAYWWQGLDWKKPDAYKKFFNKNSDESEEKKLRYLNNNKFDDYYKQINCNDFSKIIYKLLEYYEKYLQDKDWFRTHMTHNKAKEGKFVEQYKFVFNNLRDIMEKKIKNEEDANEILTDFDTYHLCMWWAKFCDSLADDLKTIFPHPENTKKKKFTWKNLRSKK